MKTCTKCGKEYPSTGEWFYSNGWGGLRSDCKHCTLKSGKEWYRNNTARHRELSEKYRIENKELLTYKLRVSTIKRRYNKTEEEVVAMMNHQQGCCAICGESLDHAEIRDTAYCIDHCHTTGKVRGLLCNYCNTMIGLAKDDPSILQNAIIYLREWR